MLFLKEVKGIKFFVDSSVDFVDNSVYENERVIVIGNMFDSLAPSSKTTAINQQITILSHLNNLSNSEIILPEFTKEMDLMMCDHYDQFNSMKYMLENMYKLYKNLEKEEEIKVIATRYRNIINNTNSMKQAS